MVKARCYRYLCHFCRKEIGGRTIKVRVDGILCFVCNDCRKSRGYNRLTFELVFKANGINLSSSDNVPKQVLTRLFRCIDREFYGE